MIKVEVSKMKFIFTLFSKIFGAKTEAQTKLKAVYEPTSYSDSEIISLLKSLNLITDPIILDFEHEVVRLGDEAYIEFDEKAEVIRIKDRGGNTLALRKKEGGKWYVHQLILLRLKLESEVWGGYGFPYIWEAVYRGK
jgi:hypothetical protein